MRLTRTGRLEKRTLILSLQMSAMGHVWTALMCGACLCGGEAAGHNAMRGSGPNRKHAFKDALTHAGSPDPRIDLICITSSFPRPLVYSRCQQQLWFFVSLSANHDRPGHPPDLV